jgi:hypothetical protein
MSMAERWVEAIGGVLGVALVWVLGHWQGKRRRVEQIPRPISPRSECRHNPAECLRQIEAKTAVIEAEQRAMGQKVENLEHRYDRVEELFLQLQRTLDRLEGYLEAHDLTPRSEQHLRLADHLPE